MFVSGYFGVFKKPIALVLALVLCLETGTVLLSRFVQNLVREAKAAVVVIESAPSTDSNSHTIAGSNIVFLDDLVGYRFFRSSDGRCRYRKTTDAGATWAASVIVDNQTDCIGITAWYDRWTPGDTGRMIHIATMDTSDDHIFYNRLDTLDDSLLLTTATSTTLGSPATYTAAANRHSITKSTTGVIYVVADDAQGSNIQSCSSNCGVSTNWSAVGTPPQGDFDSWSMVLPLASGNIMLINRSTGNVMRSSIWNGSTWSSFVTIDASAVRNTTFDVGFAATVDTDTNDIYLAYVADNNNFTTANHDIRTAVYSSGSWTNKPDIITNDPDRGLLQIAIGRDQNNGDIYVAFTARADIGVATSVNVYAYRSTDGMDTWGSEIGPINSTSGTFYGIGMNLMSFDRLFISWFDAVTATRAIYGETLADIGPEVRLSAVGSTVSTVREGSTEAYLGGAFWLESVATRTVSSIVITESGTINAETSLANIKLLYDVDETVPFDCSSESFTGTEPQFGSTVVGGFSGADGTASFTASPVTVGPSRGLCFYVVLDVLESAVDGETIQLSVSNPKNDVIVSGGVDVFPFEPVLLNGSTTVVASDLTQTGYHWRNDNGDETGATSATAGVENTPLPAIVIGEPIRLRLAVSNEGSTTSVSTTFALEVASPSPTCELASGWTMVGEPTSDWEIYDSTWLTHGQHTTNIATSTGGLTDPRTNFQSTNQGVRTISATTTPQVVAVDSFVEFEFSLQASTTAVEGESYCFRLTRDGDPLEFYTHYPLVTITSDVTVEVFGDHRATTTINTANVLSGGGFAVIEKIGGRNVTELTFTQIGTIAAGAITELRLRYQLDTGVPYDCSNVTFTGSESLFGTAGSLNPSTDKITFTDTVAITTTDTLCVMLEYDLNDQAANGQTIKFAIDSPALDVVVTGGASIGPSGTLTVPGETEVEAGTLTQTGYHWRNNDGDEINATSATGGTENTPLNDFLLNAPIRLRLSVVNDSVSASAAPTRFRLEYAPKITTCNMATVWTDVGAAPDSFDMFDSAHLSNGEDTTNIAIGSGGVTDFGSVFITPNGGVRDVESLTGTTTLGADEFVELEFSLVSTDFTPYSTTFCFRVSAHGVPLSSYHSYAELTTAPKRDFRVQRGSEMVSGTSTALIAGIDYIAPQSTSTAFVRITNSHHTGAGHDTGSTAAQNVKDVTARLVVTDITDSFTIVRAASPINNTRVDWEIVEFIGKAGTDNEIVVRSVNSLNFSNSAVVATGTPATTVTDDAQVVVFVTGVSNNNTSRNYYAGQVTAEWNAATKSPVFRRGNAGSSVIDVSYAVVEFVGQNWRIQRVEHAYVVAGDTETENITPVNSRDRTFLHVQKRMGATTNVVHFGHEVWLSSIGAVSFRIEPLASVAVEQTSVAWVIENTQTGVGAMRVEHSNSGTTNGGGTPFTLSVVFDNSVSLNNASMMSFTTRAAGANTTYPRPLAGIILTASDTYQIYRSNSASLMTFRTQIVSWPVADLSLRQNYYRFYEHNNALTPTDPWPPGLADLGENTPITNSDEPLGVGERVRLRITVRANNASMPAGLQDFRLQYGLRSTTCSAIGAGNWFSLGEVASSTVWRGFSAPGSTNGEALSSNPPGVDDLLISVSDRAGSLVHSNPSPPNPYPVAEGENIEYDWHLEHNGAIPQSVYCFRMVKADGAPLDGYNFYPQIRTAGFTPVSRSWRWYDDYLNETPFSPLAGENVTPIDIKNDDQLTLRVTVGETRNVNGIDIKYRLQFSEDSTFTTFTNVAATSSCESLSYWCYAEGGGVDNVVISSSTLSDADSCVGGSGDGCGRHNTIPTSLTNHVHFGGRNQEFSFTVRHTAARVGAIYYFRLYDATNNEPVPLASGASFPSLITEGPTLTFGLSGLAVGSTTAGVVVTTEADPNAIAFGGLQFNTEKIAAHRLQLTSNSSEGYQMLKYARQPLMASHGGIIPPLDATNAAPTAWASACQLSSTTTGCIGYHTTDATLSGGSTRFAPNDTYAGLATSLQEIMYSSSPTTETHDIVYRIVVNELQPAGDYETEIVYLALPAY